jgi:hypothetical protein
MRKLIIILPFAFFSCGQQSKTIPATSTEINPEDSGQQKTFPAAWSTNNSPAGDPSFVVAYDTISAYGPHSITRNVLQDKNGNIWLATWEGIIQYDGKLFINFTLKEGLNRYHVFSIMEDRAGNIWFGMIGGGVYKYDGTSFTLFTTNDGLAGNKIMCMLQDRAGNIWFGTYGDGVSRFSGNTFTNFTQQGGLGDNFVSAIAEDRTGKLWFGTNGGVSCYDVSVQAGSHMPGVKSFTAFTISKDLSFHNVRCITEDKAGNIWIGSQEGLSRYDRSASLRAGGKSVTNIAQNFATFIFEDRAGNLWLSGGEENSNEMILARYDGKSITKIKKSLQVFGITEDRDGYIWFGTAQGVCRYDPSASLREGGKSFTDFSEKVSMK